MWKSTIIVLSIVTTVSSAPWLTGFGFGLPTLNAPTSLKVGFADHETVIIQWQFDPPANLTLGHVRFIATLDCAMCIFDHFRPCWELRLHSEISPLTHKITRLSPGTPYSFFVMATHPDWRDSEKAWISFVTPKTDYPTPTITNMTRTERLDVAEYEVRWNKVTGSKLKSIFVEVCEAECFTYRQPTTATVAFIPLKFHSKFSIRAFAVYFEEVVGKITRYSDYIDGFSEREPVANLLDAEVPLEVEANRIKLPWHPLLPFGGPRSYYEILVTDPTQRSSDTGLHIVPENLGFSLIRSPTIHDALEMSFERAKNYATRRSRAEKAVSLKIVSRSKSVVRIRIVFTQVPEDSLNAKLPAKFLLLGPSVAEALAFSPYEPIYFSIRNCLYTMKHPLNSCGNETGAEVWSRVAAPSPVANLRFRPMKDDDIEFFWDMPANPHGPIDGYQVKLRRIPASKQLYTTGTKTLEQVHEEEEIRTLHRSIRSYIGDGEIRTFGVAAFNIDREDNNKELFSDWKFVSRVVPKPRKLFSIILLGTTAFVLSVVTFCYGSYIAFFRIPGVPGEGAQHHMENHVPIGIPNGGIPNGGIPNGGIPNGGIPNGGINHVFHHNPIHIPPQLEGEILEQFV